MGTGLVCKDKLVGVAWHVVGVCGQGENFLTEFIDLRRFHNWIKTIVNRECCPGIVRLSSGSQRLTYSFFKFTLQSLIFIIASVFPLKL